MDGALSDVPLLLAVGADERCRAAGPDLLDERATHGTQLAFAVSDQEFHKAPQLATSGSSGMMSLSYLESATGSARPGPGS